MKYFFRSDSIRAFIFFVLLTLLIFWKVFLKGFIPFPGDYLMAWYEPWKSDTYRGIITVAHKPIADDVFRHLYPLRVLASGLMKHWELPLWNPYNGLGMPLLAIMHPGYLNPFGFIFLFLPPQISWAVYIGIQPLLLGIFTYFYCRKVRLSFLASIFSSFTLIFSGFVIVRLIFGEFIYALSMLPLLLYLIEDLIEKNIRKMFIIPFAVLFIFISGQPHMAMYILIFVFVYMLYRLINFSAKGVCDKRCFFLFMILALLGIGLSAIQLVPSFELYRLSTIDRSSSEFIFNRFLLPIKHLVTIAIPNYFGNQATYNYWGPGDYIETVAYVGLIPLFLGYLTLFVKKSFRYSLINFFAFSVLLTILGTLDWFGTRWFYALPVPVISADVPSRIFVLTTFSISILAGFGFDLLARRQLGGRLIKQSGLFILVIGGIVAFTFSKMFLGVICPVKEIKNCWTISVRNTSLELSVFGIFFASFLLAIKKTKAYWSTICLSVTCLGVLSLGFYNASKFLPFSKKETVLPENRVIKILKEKTRDARVFGLGEANLKTNLSTSFLIYDPNYYDPLHIKRYAELIYFANTGKLVNKLPRSDVEIIQDVAPGPEVDFRRDRLFKIISVKYLLYKKTELPFYLVRKDNVVWNDDDWYLTENQALPKVYFVTKYEVMTDNEKALTQLFTPSFDYANTVLLDEKPVLVADINDALSAQAKIEEYEPNKVRLQTISSGESLMVFTDNYYPGWKAYLDNQETKIYRTNYALRSIVVPKGVHQIEFVYKPMALALGVLISFFSLIIICIWVIIIFKDGIILRDTNQ